MTTAYSFERSGLSIEAAHYSIIPHSLHPSVSHLLRSAGRSSRVGKDVDLASALFVIAFMSCRDELADRFSVPRPYTR